MWAQHVVLLARRQAVLDAVGSAVREAGGEATTLTCDVCDDASVAAAFQEVSAIGPTIDVLVYNVAPPFQGEFGSFPAPHEVDPALLTQGFDIGVSGCLRCVKHAVPGMLERGRGTILLSGATMAIRGGQAFACQSPVKFALRSLSQSMYQSYAPAGVHVAHVVIDGRCGCTAAMAATLFLRCELLQHCTELHGAVRVRSSGVIDSPNTHAWGEKMQLMDPAAIADAYLALHNQPLTVSVSLSLALSLSFVCV